MGRRVHGRSSTTVCRDVLAALDRIYLTEGPDEPDLGLNVAYVSGRLSLQRLASAEAWRVPSSTVAAIREALAEMLVTTRPGELERQLLTFPAWVLKRLDRRDPSRPPGDRLASRRRRTDPGTLAERAPATATPAMTLGAGEGRLSLPG
jgi:hypothetical protein